jgi:hypothetical protein
MAREVYRYSFPPEVSLDDVEASLLLAVWAVESLHGESQARLDASHLLDKDKRSCVIDAATPVGRDLNRLFVGYVRREFGCTFRVERIAGLPGKSEEVTA